MKRAAVFDIDRTLLDGMSGYLFAAYLWRTGAMPRLGRWRSARALILYRLGLVSEMAIVESGVTCYAGLREIRVRELAAAAVAAAMAPRFYREGLAAVARHRERGEPVLLATGSSVFLAQAIAAHVGADDGIGTDSLRRDGRLQPVMKKPACVAEGKKILVSDWLAAKSLTPAEAIVYTDNGIDLPLLEIVGEVVAVNPDAQLAAQAARRGWRVEQWVTPVDGRRRRSGTRWPLKS